MSIAQDSLILTAYKGEIPIQHIQKGDLLSTRNGTKIVEKVIPVGISNVLELALARGYRLHCTLNQTVLVDIQFVIEDLISLSELALDDKVIVTIDKVNFISRVEYIHLNVNIVPVYDLVLSNCDHYLANSIVVGCPDYS